MIKNILIVGLLALVVGGGYWWYRNQTVVTNDEVALISTTTPNQSQSASQTITVAEEGESMLGGASSKLVYKGKKLAGDSSPLLDFTSEDYEAAKLSDKLVVLYFYANWCPICREEFPKMEDAFDELTGDRVIGFRVNYNDNQTSAAERALASELGVTAENTKILIRTGETLSQSSDPWDKEHYLAEID